MAQLGCGLRGPGEVAGMGLLRWWRGRRQAARLDLSIRASYYLNLVLVPILAVGGFGSQVGAAIWLVAPLIAVHVALCLLVVRAGLDSERGIRPRPVRLVAGVVALAGAGCRCPESARIQGKAAPGGGSADVQAGHSSRSTASPTFGDISP